MSSTHTLPTVDWDAPTAMKLLFESVPVAIAVVNRQGTLLYSNQKLQELFGYAQNELAGQPIEILIPARLHQAHVQHRQDYVQAPHVRTMGAALDLVARRKDGAEFPIEVGLSYVRINNPDEGDANNDLIVMVTVNDISRRKQAEEELERRVAERTRELDRRRQVADSLRDILTFLNSNRPLHEILNYICVQAAQLFAATATSIYGCDDHTDRLAAQANHNTTAQELVTIEEMLARLVGAQALAAGAPVVAPLLPSVAQPAPDRCATHLVVPLLVKGDLYGVLVFCYTDARDFSIEDIELARTLGNQTALAIENARLHTQIERTAVAAERNRLARDLHDSVTQTLFSASMIAEVLPRIWNKDLLAGRQRLEELRELTRGALAEMRTLLLELRPAKLMEVEIAELLQQLAEAIAGRARVPILVEIDGDPQLPADVKIALYRVAQEALNNVAKHAQATQAQIILICRPKSVKLTVRDDGVGFVFETIKPAHLGLGIMRERAEDIGATLSVHSKPGAGTAIVIQWPRVRR